MLYRVMQVSIIGLSLLLNVKVYGNTREFEEIKMYKKQMGIDYPIEPAIGISKEDRLESIRLLNVILADENVLYHQTLNYHWNLAGPQFNDYHQLFKNGLPGYEKIFDFIDDVAERVTTLGGIALGTMAEFVKAATIQEDGGDIPDPRTMVKRLLDSHEAIIRNIRDAVKKTADTDAGTNNFLTDLMEKHEKAAWFLRKLAER